MCCIFPRVEQALVLLCFIFRAWNALWLYYAIFSAHGTRSGVIVFYFSACGTRSGVILLYFLRVERTLALLCYLFCMWNALWFYCVIFSTHGTRSGVISLYFPHVEHALALLC